MNGPVNPLDHPESDHEMVSIKRDLRVPLTAIIAIHNRNLGPAIGGCRIYPYASMEEALTDVLRLSRGMTYKCAIAGIPYGGGKSVIVADPNRDKSKQLLHAMGDFVESLGGGYITSFDSGTTLEDIAVIGERTAHIGGIAAGFGNASQSTATGLFHCIREALRYRGRGLEEARIAVQGAGNVGARLTTRLREAGAEVIIADIDRARAEATGATVCDPAHIHTIEADVFAPCAFGAGLNSSTIPNLGAKIVAGGANNQLATPEDAVRLRDAGVLFCPDFLVNAGGIVELHHQKLGSTHEALETHLRSLADTLREVIEEADRSNDTTFAVAERLAEARFMRVRP